MEWNILIMFLEIIIFFLITQKQFSMYKEHFGLKELPFSIAPDPRDLFMSEKHREALAYLVYGINSDGGFVLLTGEVRVLTANYF